MSEYVVPASAVIVPYIGGGVGFFATRKAIGKWYVHLKKPKWTPKNRTFGPVWSVLYGSMGYASFLVWRDGGGFNGPNRLPLALYAGQLALNWAWTPFFFGIQRLDWATAESVVLFGAVAGTVATFYPVNKMAAALLTPYLAWVGMATALTYTIWKLNKDRKD